MLERFRAHLESRPWFGPDFSCLVAYSGGRDSTCLLHLLNRCGAQVVAGHLHHGLRPEADDELERCRAFAESLGVPFVSGRADVPRLARDRRLGEEEAGRMARYGFLEQAARQLELPWIATAHTRTDHLETIVLNLVRGTGLAGLGGIPEVRGNVVRPLLPFTREETGAYCTANGLWFHDDPGNSDLDRTRSRLRNTLMPHLLELHPQAEAAMTRLSALAAEEDRFLDHAAAAALEAAELPVNGPVAFLTRDCEIVLDAPSLARLPHVLLRRAVRLVVEALGAGLDFDQSECAAVGIGSGGTGSITAEGGQVVIEWDEGRVHAREVRPVEPFRYPLTVPGETESDAFGWRLTAWHGEPSGESFSREALRIAIDAAAIKGPPYFRSAEPGDTMQPAGFEGTRKLADLLSETKWTLAARRRLPIICDMVGPIWAPGVSFADRVKLRGPVTTALHLAFGPIDSPKARTIETAPQNET